MRMRMVVVAVWIACHAGMSSVYADPISLQSGVESAITPQQSADARVALEAMALSLRAVRSGTCRMQCRYQYDPNEKGQGKHSDTGENIFIAFDKTQDLYRYDDLETRYSGLPNQKIVRPDVVLVCSAAWKTGGPSPIRTIIRRSRTDVDNPFKHQRDPYVTVLAGCVSNRMHLTHSGSLDRFLDQTLPTATVISYEKTDPDLVRMTVRHESLGLKATVEYDLTLNSTQGYVPVRVLMRHNATKSAAWTDPDVIETEWIPANGVYVPKRSQSRGTYSKKSELTFEMDWKYVNEPLHPALFSEEALSPKKGDRVVVAQADKHVVERIVGFEVPKLPARQPDPPPRRLRFALILLANALAFGAVFYLLRRRRLASRKS